MFKISINKQNLNKSKSWNFNIINGEITPNKSLIILNMINISQNLYGSVILYKQSFFSEKILSYEDVE